MKKITLFCVIISVVLGSFIGCNQAKEDEKVTISVLTAMAYGTERLDQLVENYEAAHPNVEIEVQHAPNDYDVVLKSRINSGQFPDIAAGQTGSHIATLYDYAYDFSNEASIVDLFNEDAIEISKSSDGKVMSLPWTYESMGIIYNKVLFEQAGITKLPKTMDELEAVCKTLEANGILPFANASKEPWVLGHIVSHYLSAVNPNPNDTIAQISSGQVKFEDIDDFRNVFRLLDLMTAYGPEKVLEIDWEKSENMLSNNEAAMIHMGDWCEATLLKFNPDVNVGFLPVPINDNPMDTTILSSISWQFILNKDADELDIKKDFMKYMLTSEDAQDWMTQTVGAVPAAKTDMKPAGMLATSAKLSIDKGETKPWNHNLWPAGYHVEVGALLQTYISGDQDAETIMIQITDGWLDRVE